MRVKIRSKQGSFLLSLLFVIGLFGCSNKFQDMESAYQDGRYIASAKLAIEGMRDPALRPQILEFMKKNGEDLLKKAVLRGQVLEQNTESDEAIQYYQALETVLQEMRFLDFSLLPLEKTLENSRVLKNNFITRYIETQYMLGVKAYKNRTFRKSLDHFLKINTYSLSDYQDTAQYMEKAAHSAKRAISVTPFFKPADPMTQILTDTISGIITGTAPPKGILKIPLKIENVDILSLVTALLIQDLNHKKSRFLSFSLDAPHESIEGKHYYMEGIIDAEVARDKTSTETKTDILRYRVEENGVSRWRDFSFQYLIMRRVYEISLTVQAQLYLAKSDKKVTGFVVTKHAVDEKQWRSVIKELPEKALEIAYPEGYTRISSHAMEPNKMQVIERAVQKTVHDLSTMILETIDKDLDPFILDDH